jgi:negative regulator of flagellin synthesis FlgM
MTRFQEELRLDPQVTEIPGIRHDLVARVRQEILAGTYDTNAKLEAALERMLVQLGPD